MEPSESEECAINGQVEISLFFLVLSPIQDVSCEENQVSLDEEKAIFLLSHLSYRVKPVPEQCEQ